MTGLTADIRLIVADNHDFYRNGLVSFLKKERGITVVGEAANGRQLVKLVLELQPDIVITDLKMPEVGGVEAIKQISEAGSAARCIALSCYDYEHLVVDAVEAGASGYLVKDIRHQELMEAIRTVYNNKRYYCTVVSARLAKNIARRKDPAVLLPPGKMLSPLEQEILKELCHEKSSKEIAQKLFLSKKTIDFHRDKIRKKIKVKSTIGLIIYAIQNGLLDSED